MREEDWAQYVMLLESELQKFCFPQDSRGAIALSTLLIKIDEFVPGIPVERAVDAIDDWVSQTLLPDSTFQAAETAVQSHPSDWRPIFELRGNYYIFSKLQEYVSGLLKNLGLSLDSALYDQLTPLVNAQYVAGMCYFFDDLASGRLVYADQEPAVHRILSFGVAAISKELDQNLDRALLGQSLIDRVYRATKLLVSRRKQLYHKPRTPLNIPEERGFGSAPSFTLVPPDIYRYCSRNARCESFPTVAHETLAEYRLIPNHEETIINNSHALVRAVNYSHKQNSAGK